jgi:hypothetical protein
MWKSSIFNHLPLPYQQCLRKAFQEMLPANTLFFKHKPIFQNIGGYKNTLQLIATYEEN